MIWTIETHQSAKFKTLDCSHEISPNLYFDRLLLLKAYTISAIKSIEDLCLTTVKIDAKFEEKLICYFKNDKSFVNFELSTRNSQNFYFYWLLLHSV